MQSVDTYIFASIRRASAGQVIVFFMISAVCLTRKKRVDYLTSEASAATGISDCHSLHGSAVFTVTK